MSDETPPRPDDTTDHDVGQSGGAASRAATRHRLSASNATPSQAAAIRLTTTSKKDLRQADVLRPYFVETIATRASALGRCSCPRK